MWRVGLTVPLLAVAGLAVACGDDSDPVAAPATTVLSTTVPPSPTSAATTLPEATTIAVPTTASAAPGQFRFTSTYHPYVLTAPADVVAGPAQPAKRAWDGEGKVVAAGSNVDTIFFSDGTLFVFGTTTPGDLTSLAQKFADQMRRFHGCTEPQHQRDVTVGTAPGIAFTHGCGAGSANIVARIVIVGNGVGVLAFTTTSAGQEEAAIDRLVDHLSGLELGAT